MSSTNTASSHQWSLTRRLAWMHALTTSTLILLFAVWSGWFAYDVTRSDLLDFIEHETSELRLGIEHTDGLPGQIQDAVDKIAQVTSVPQCGFRVRDRAGRVLATGGRNWLLEAIPDGLSADVDWDSRLFDLKVVTGSTPVPDYELMIELLVDARTAAATIRRHWLYASVAFLVSVVLAGFSGWFTAHRGLQALREVATQAGEIQLPSERGPIRLEGAPTEIREVGEALNAMLLRIDKGLHRMRTFTAGLAHELRSPLQNLIGETEVTLLSDRSEEEYRGLLKSNLEDMNALSDAVDNLVAFCRTAEPDRRNPTRERFDLASEAELRLERERQTAQRSEVRLEIQRSGNTSLYADREGCLRVMRNIVGNAISWSPPDTTVHVSIDGSDDIVSIVVQDEGPGVPEHLGRRIFEPFISGRDRPDKRRSYGLGLAICRSIVHDHGGRLFYENRNGRGARFVAQFPRTTPPS